MGKEKLNKKEVKARVMCLLDQNPNDFFTLKKLFGALRFTTHPVKMLCVDVLNALYDEGKIIIGDNNTVRRGRSKRREAKRRKTKDDNQVMHEILQEYGLPYGYPNDIAKYAEQFTPEISKRELSKREDFRDVLTFTIDPHDAKDFDDALSLRVIAGTGGKKGSAVYEVGVHIADVSHYVREGSPLDEEALRRGTSIYLVDRTIPMLPERLCNFICSLRPDEEKLTYSVIFEMNEKADVLSYHIARTVIKSNRRFTYDEVDEVLSSHKSDNQEYTKALTSLHNLATKLHERRLQSGAIEFNRDEMRFEVDEGGHPTGIYFHESTPATSLIEEFMLLANRTVAEHIGSKRPAKTFPYRVHDVPDTDKLRTLAQFVKKLHYSLNAEGSKEQVTKSLNKLLSDVKEESTQKLVTNIALRAMMKAKYSTNNIGHYGLGFNYYTHFTSPIRRYPDILVHRLLTRYIKGSASVSKRKYEHLCEHASNMEQLATAAERASVKYKMVEFLNDRVGQQFDATIVGVTAYGIFSEINENHCEGFTNCRSLSRRREAFDFDEQNFCLTSRRSHERFQIGDQIRIRIAKTNIDRKTVDFGFIKKIK